MCTGSYLVYILFTDDGTGVLGPGPVAAFSIIGVIAALVGIVTPLIGLIYKVAQMIHSKTDYIIKLYTMQRHRKQLLLWARGSVAHM